MLNYRPVPLRSENPTYYSTNYRNYVYQKLHDKLDNLIQKFPTVSLFMQIKQQLTSDLRLKKQDRLPFKESHVKRLECQTKSTIQLLQCFELCERLAPFIAQNYQDINIQLQDFFKNDAIFNGETGSFTRILENKRSKITQFHSFLNERHFSLLGFYPTFNSIIVKSFNDWKENNVSSTEEIPNENILMKPISPTSKPFFNLKNLKILTSPPPVEMTSSLNPLTKPNTNGASAIASKESLLRLLGPDELLSNSNVNKLNASSVINVPMEINLKQAAPITGPTIIKENEAPLDLNHDSQVQGLTEQELEELNLNQSLTEDELDSEPELNQSLTMHEDNDQNLLSKKRRYN